MKIITIEIELRQGYSLEENENFIICALNARNIKNVIVIQNEIGVIGEDLIEATNRARFVIEVISNYGLVVRRVR